MPKVQTIKSRYERRADVTAGDGDVITVAVSSETPVERWFGSEVLSHEPGAINMERASDGLPLLVGHDQGGLPAGRLDNFRLDADGKTRGELRFSKRAEAQQVEQDIRDGIVTDVSVGYRIEDYEETDDGVRVTRWTPLEVSMVSVPADHTVGVFRSNDGSASMADVKDGATGGTGNVLEYKAVQAQARTEGENAGRAAVLETVRAIRERFAPFVMRADIGNQMRALMDDCIDRGLTQDQAVAELLRALEGQAMPVQQSGYQQTAEGRSADQGQRSPFMSVSAQPQMRHGRDDYEGWRDGVTEALMLKVGLVKDDAERKRGENPFMGLSLAEMARGYVERQGGKLGGMSRMQVVGEAFTRMGQISHSTSDFSSILADVAHKSLLQGYQETPETWSMWTNSGSLSDFKTALRPNLSLFSDLEKIGEGGEYTYGTYGDKHEPIVLATYGKLFSISRQAVINDDLNALSRIPAGMGRAAARQVGHLVYAVVTSNPVMNEDGVALFNAAHGNLNSGGAAVPSVDSVDAIRVAMGLQKDPSGNGTLGVRPEYMLVPLELETKAQTLREAEYNPASTAGTLEPNTVQGSFAVIGEHRLSSDSPTRWYMTSSPGAFPTIEVAFLDGNQSPYMESQDGWSQDGAQYKVRLDAGVAPLDFRGMNRNDGA